MKKGNILTIATLLVFTAGFAFFGGMKYQEGKQPKFFRQTGSAGGSVVFGSRANIRPVSGEIIDSDEKSMTVKMPDGGSKIVIIGEKTELNKVGEAKREDLKIGEKVAVFGQENSDGTITAQTIQLNPLLKTVHAGDQPK